MLDSRKNFSGLSNVIFYIIFVFPIYQINITTLSIYIHFLFSLSLFHLFLSTVFVCYSQPPLVFLFLDTTQTNYPFPHFFLFFPHLIHSFEAYILPLVIEKRRRFRLLLSSVNSPLAAIPPPPTTNSPFFS